MVNKESEIIKFIKQLGSGAVIEELKDRQYKYVKCPSCLQNLLNVGLRKDCEICFVLSCRGKCKFARIDDHLRKNNMSRFLARCWMHKDKVNK